VKWLRPIGLIAAILSAALALTAYVVYLNQSRVVEFILSRLSTRTGLQLKFDSVRLHFGGHLAVILLRPRLVEDGSNIAQLEELRAVISYHSLVASNGLPLRALALIAPRLNAPREDYSTANTIIPRPGPQIPAYLHALLKRIAAVARKIELQRAKVYSQDGKTLILEGDLTAYHHRFHSSTWYLRSVVNVFLPPLDGVKLRANLVTASVGDLVGNVVAQGRIEVNRNRMTVVSMGGLDFSGTARAVAELQLNEDGELDLRSSIDAAQVAISGSPLSSPETIGDCQIGMDFRADSKSFTIPQFRVRRDQAEVLRGTLALQNAYAPDPTLALKLDSMAVSADTISRIARKWRNASASTLAVARALTAGDLIIDKVELNSALASLQRWNLADLARSSQVEFRLSDVAAGAEIGNQRLTVRRLNMAIAYARENLTIKSGSGEFGRSRLTTISGRANLARLPASIAYTMRIGGDLAADEFYQLALARLPDVRQRVQQKIQLLGGTARFTFSANGRLNPRKFEPPSDFVGELNPRRIEIGLKSVGRAIMLAGGKIGIQPGVLRVEGLVIQAAGSNAENEIHSVTITTDLSRSNDRLVFHNATIDFNRVSAQKWMPLFIDPERTAVIGEISGRLHADGYVGKTANYRVTGNLTIGPGQVQFGFLRAPILTSSVAVALDGKGIRFNVPNALVEGSRVDLVCTVPDFANPQLELDANADNLDLELMKFIRLPWMPPTPVMLFLIPIKGHLHARRASLERLVMNNASADYSYDRGNWRVHNLRAETMDGRITLQLSGRKEDNWIHIKTQVESLDGAKLLGMLQPGQSPLMIGTIKATADLTADSDIDFFSTMRGSFSLNIARGRLARFVIFSRVLGLIDVRNWFADNASDPRVHGLPFDSLTADFNGENGIFRTDNFRLAGPVMDALAQGKIDLGARTIDMEIGMVPFNTVSWLMSKIPLIGMNLALSSGTLLAAYVQVHGPIDNPSVTAKPITSLAEFIKKIVTLPINVVKPNTIQ
jgi:hypothetical protein